MFALPAGILGAGFVEEFEKMHDPMPTSKKKPSSSFSVADEIRKFAQLRADALISDAEFADQKAWLLKRK